MDGRFLIFAFRDECTSTTAAMDGRFLIFANKDVSKRNTSAGCALPVSGYDTTADYGMGLVPIFYLWILDFSSFGKCGHGWALFDLSDQG